MLDQTKEEMNNTVAFMSAVMMQSEGEITYEDLLEVCDTLGFCEQSIMVAAMGIGTIESFGVPWSTMRDRWMEALRKEEA